MAKEIDIGAYSAYAIAVEHGYEGTEAEFAAQLTNSAANGELAQDGAERAEAAAAEAEEILASIPEDYTTLSEMAVENTEKIGQLSEEIAVERDGKRTITEVVQGTTSGPHGDFAESDTRLRVKGINGFYPVYAGQKIIFTAGEKITDILIGKYPENQDHGEETTWMHGNRVIDIDWNGRIVIILRSSDNAPITVEDYDATLTVVSKIQAKLDYSHWQGKKWYAYGTSLTSNAQGKYADYVAQLSGLNLTNKGIPGGALVANRNIYNALMSTSDGKADADLITIEVGANDYSSPLGDVSSMDTSTFCGALNTCLQNVLSNCPKAQVVLMCSTRQSKSDDGLTLSSLDNKNPHGVTYEERDEAIRRVAAANGVYFIPFGSGLGLGLFRMQSSDIYNVDHIHHTNLGGYNLAQGVWAYLRNIPLWYNTLPE